MTRTARHATIRRAFGERLRRLVRLELNSSPADVARALGYRDASTLRAAFSGRAGLDSDRLVKLAAWSASRGTPVNLHWLLTGETTPLLPGPEVPREVNLESWLTPARDHALQVLAEAVRHLPMRPA